MRHQGASIKKSRKWAKRLVIGSAGIAFLAFLSGLAGSIGEAMIRRNSGSVSLSGRNAGTGVVIHSPRDEILWSDDPRLLDDSYDTIR